MATIAGKDASLSLAATGVERYAHSWTIDFAFDALEDTNWDWAAANKGWRSFISGLQGWTGSFECRQQHCIDSDLLEPGPWVGSFYVDLTNTSGFTGTILVTGISVAAPIEGIQSLSCSFTGVGAPSLMACTT